MLVPLLALQVVALPPLLARADGSPAGPSQPTRVSVEGCSATAPAVPLDYLGLSIEWSMVEHWFGTSADTAVESTVALLSSLRDSPLTTGVLRIGGSSQDGYRWAPDGDTTGNRLFFGKITPGMVDALLRVAQRAGWKVVLGLNLRDDQPEEAAALARYAVQRDVGKVLLAVAPGNEPDEYLPSTEAYLERYQRYADALAQSELTRALPLTGPDVSNNADLGRVEALRRRFGSRLAFVGWHDYANRPSLAKLLSPEVSKRWADRMSAAAAAAGPLMPSRMSEGNSVGRGGLNRVSDVTGSTAWTIDTMLSGAAAGLAGFNLHAWDNHYYMQPGWKARYTPFFVRGGMTFPAPGVYALALLRSLPGRRFCEVQLTAPAAGSTVRAWALAGVTRRQAVVYLVNKGTRRTHTTDVALALPSEFAGGAAVTRLQDTYGCGGRSTNLNGAVLQRTGALTWSPTPVARSADGTVHVRVRPCESVMVTVNRDDGSPTAVLPAPL